MCDYNLNGKYISCKHADIFARYVIYAESTEDAIVVDNDDNGWCVFERANIRYWVDKKRYITETVGVMVGNKFLNISTYGMVNVTNYADRPNNTWKTASTRMFTRMLHRGGFKVIKFRKCASECVLFPNNDVSFRDGYVIPGSKAYPEIPPLVIPPKYVKYIDSAVRESHQIPPLTENLISEIPRILTFVHGGELMTCDPDMIHTLEYLSGVIAQDVV